MTVQLERQANIDIRVEAGVNNVPTERLLEKREIPLTREHRAALLRNSLIELQMSGTRALTSGNDALKQESAKKYDEGKRDLVKKLATSREAFEDFNQAREDLLYI